MQSATNLISGPNKDFTPRVVIIDSRINAPSEHLLDDFDKDSVIAQKALADSVVAITARRFPNSIIKLAGEEFFDSTATGTSAEAWSVHLPKQSTLRQAWGDTGKVLLLSDARFAAGYRPMGTFERIWYRDPKTGFQKSQPSFKYVGMASLINQATGQTEMLQLGYGYADYTFAITKNDWFRAYGRRLDALGINSAPSVSSFGGTSE